MTGLRLRFGFDGRITAFAIVTLLTSVASTGRASGWDLSHLILLSASFAAFFRFASTPRPGIPALIFVAALAISPAVNDGINASWWSVSPHNLLEALFGAQGLLYGAPLLWAGYLGLIPLRREHPELTRLALAALLPGTLALSVATDQGDGSTLAATWLPFLLPGIAECFRQARSLAERRPERVVATVAALLIVWNLLFMEQYRRRLLPSDDTVSFAQVTSNSASLLSRFVGTPFAWPANWIFAMRHGAPPDHWDAVAGRRLFAGAKAAMTTIEIGDDPTVFAPDTALLLEGFGARRTCERGWCRDLDGAGRLLLPLQDVGHGDFVVRIRARGQGSLSLSMNRASTSISEMSESLTDVTLRAPARLLHSGINVLSLVVAGGGKATLDRLTLERDLGSGSAR